MALPGSTVAALKGDLAYHFDLPIEVFVHRTVMLPNSPMADPKYQREHGIEVDEQKRVSATATMSAADIEAAALSAAFSRASIDSAFYGTSFVGCSGKKDSIPWT